MGAKAIYSLGSGSTNVYLYPSSIHPTPPTLGPSRSPQPTDPDQQIQHSTEKSSSNISRKTGYQTDVTMGIERDDTYEFKGAVLTHLVKNVRSRRIKSGEMRRGSTRVQHTILSSGSVVFKRLLGYFGLPPIYEIQGSANAWL